jgi:hypothetical protein
LISDAPILLTERKGRRDFYDEFIEGSRWLKREQAAARAEWFDGLKIPDKEHLLFEFEMLLKGLVCFGNPVNHPGPPLRGDPAVARPFKAELNVIREIMRRIVEVGRRLTAYKGKSIVFQRYVESIIGQDEARFKLVKQSLDQDMPDQSMALIVQAFSNLGEIVEGLQALPYVSYRLFSNIIHAAQREIHRSTYFDPLAALEFRAEFDRVRPEEIGLVMKGLRSEAAARVAALSFLSLFRLLSYIRAADRAIHRKMPPANLFAWLAVLRSDIRALIIFFRREAARWLSSGFNVLFEREYPDVVRAKFETLEAEFYQLRALKELLMSMGDQLRLEQVKVYEQQLPAVSGVGTWDQFIERTGFALGSLKSFIQNAAAMLAKELDPTVDVTNMFPDFVSAAERSERLRRDVWMFRMVLRAFIEKTKGSFRTTDQWSEMSTFRFVREFVGYFRSMGYQLLRYSDYAEFDKFMALVDRLREGDVLEVQRISNVIAACEDFMTFLDKTFEAVSRREELIGVTFDKKEAARTLKLFLKR